MKPASRFGVPELDDLPADVRARIDEVQEKSGFVPNVFLALARRADEFRAFFAYHDALMLRESGLSKAEKEMIVVATSAANDCTYCVVAHGAILRIYAKDAHIADQLAANYRSAEITPRQRAMLDFAVKLARQPATVEEADLAALREAGFSGARKASARPGRRFRTLRGCVIVALPHRACDLSGSGSCPWTTTPRTSSTCSRAWECRTSPTSPPRRPAICSSRRRPRCPRPSAR